VKTVKIDFPLDVDEDGYPPISVETMNGIKLENNLIQIDNTPFFIEGIAVGDKVRCNKSKKNKNYQFVELIEEGKNKSISIIFINDACKEDVYQYLKSLNCYCEYGEFRDFNMLAVDIKDSVRYSDIEQYLMKKELIGAISYAELCV